MICLNQYREPIDLEDSPYRMPTTVILEPHDKEDVVYDKLSARYAKLIEQWQEEERDRFYKRETRYENDHEEPAFPSPSPAPVATEVVATGVRKAAEAPTFSDMRTVFAEIPISPAAMTAIGITIMAVAVFEIT